MRMSISFCLCAALTICGCDKGAQAPDDAPDKPAAPQADADKAPPAPVPEDTESTDPLVGKWTRIDSPGKLYWHFASSGEFFAAFSLPDKADKSEFPKTFQAADRWTGQWKVEGDELVLTKLSAPSQPPHKDVRLSLKRPADNTITEIDGVKYKKETL